LHGSTSLKEEPLLEEPVDAVAANSPIEPGSGTPDLGAIMKRVRDERKNRADGNPGQSNEDIAKNDFLAPARRAAQAAAADAEILRNKSVKSVRTSEGGLSALFQKQRKPIMMVAFAALLALTGLQLKKAFFNQPAQTAAITETVEQQPEAKAASVDPIETAAKPEDTAVTDTASADSGTDVRSVEMQSAADLSAKSPEPGLATSPVAASAESTDVAPVTVPEMEAKATAAESAPTAAPEAKVAATPKEDLPPAEYGPIPLR
jgi:localization factor PodJL